MNFIRLTFIPIILEGMEQINKYLLDKLLQK